MDQVTLIGRIPESPQSGAVEGLLRRTVGACRGLWEIRIRHLPQTPWCLLRIKRSSDGFKCTLLLDLYEEPLEQVAMGLSEALRFADGQIAGGATVN
jgi:hypothetical protein